LKERFHLLLLLPLGRLKSIISYPAVNHPERGREREREGERGRETKRAKEREGERAREARTHLKTKSDYTGSVNASVPL
jgi:hypothetical protein